MLLIETGKGMEFTARYVMQTTHKGVPRLLIELTDVTLARAAAALDGAEKLTVTRDEAPGVTTIYEGYSRIVYMGQAEDGCARMTLERG